MVTDLLANSIASGGGGLPLIGGGVIGFGAGYILRKIAKILIIAVGGIALLFGCLEYQKWIAVNWTVVENQTSTIMTQAAHKAYMVTQQMGHEIPTGIGLGVMGFLPGLALGFAKG
jgi:uncharacterized membrane protein (Fun14 family)